MSKLKGIITQGDIMKDERNQNNQFGQGKDQHRQGQDQSRQDQHRQGQNNGTNGGINKSKQNPQERENQEKFVSDKSHQGNRPGR